MQQVLNDRLLDVATPSAVAELHRRAAVWLGERGYVDEALDHLTIIADWDAAARLLESQLDPLLNREDRRTIERWLARIPAAEIVSRPSLLLMGGWICFFNLDIPGLAQKLELVRQANAATQISPLRGAALTPRADWQLPFDNHFILLQGVVDYFAGRQEKTIAATQQTLALTPRSSTFVYSSAYYYLATAMQYTGRSIEAEKLVAEAYRREQPKSSPVSARLLFALAAVYLFSGKLSAAYEAGELLLIEARTAGLALLEGWAHDILGRIDYERNHLAAAAGHFTALRERRYAVHRGCAYDGFTGALLVAAVQGQRDAVVQISDEWRSFEQTLWGLPGPLYYSARARADLLTGAAAAAQRWAAGFTTPLPPTPLFWLESSHITKLHCLLAAGSPLDLAAANALADDCFVLVNRTHNRPLTIALTALRARLLDCAGKRSAALALLADALRLAAEEGFVRSFVDLGPGMEQLLKAVDEPQLRPYLTTLRAAFFGSQTLPPVASLPARTTIDGSVAGNVASSLDGNSDGIQPVRQIHDTHPAAALTQRELEVLALLASPLSIQEIGDKLFISYSTVRQHTAHIYEKLGVNKRRHAVLMADELGLLPSPNEKGQHN
jgi:LuxR family maltose regulon positive regulatory protein